MSGDSPPHREGSSLASPHLAIVHWLPLELYPPILNLTRFLLSDGDWRLSIFSSQNHLGRPDVVIEGASIHRYPAPGLARGRWGSLRAYLRFYLGTIKELLRTKPDVVLYVEPQSALPVFLHRLFHPSVPIFIHHHEYHDPHQFFRPGMRPARLGHLLEKRFLFPRAKWISHTNQDRLALFHKDCPTAKPEILRELPNYPPASWGAGKNVAWSVDGSKVLRFVYVGSLSMEDTYLQEFVSWFRSLPEGSATFDIYAYNCRPEVRQFLEASPSESLRFHPEGVAYDALPSVLQNYHVGLLLYRATTTNYRFNASNKLFEYLACGLDVVFPDRMLGVRPYSESPDLPRVMEWDFTAISPDALKALQHRPPGAGLRPLPTAEDALSALEESMKRALP